jgi:hypothetical protein
MIALTISHLSGFSDQLSEFVEVDISSGDDGHDFSRGAGSIFRRKK